jgi:hypothetical protein
MAKMPYGLMGPFIGKIGGIVFCNGKNGPYIRSLPKKRKDRPTPAQKLQRLKLATVSQFLTPMRDLIDISFVQKGGNKTAWGKAVSYNIQNALYSAGSKQKIRYSAAFISQGSLPRADSASAAVTAPDTITFQWADNSWLGKANASDRAITVIYCESLKKCVFITDGAYRNTGVIAIQVPAFHGKVVQTWLAFISANGQDSSPSSYTGELTL